MPQGKGKGPRPVGRKPLPGTDRAAKPAAGIRVREVERGFWEIVVSNAARQRAEDLEEVYMMLDANETEIAEDELRYLLDGCGELLEAHALLGQLAYSRQDLPLARGHYGYAFELVRKALGPVKAANGQLPYDIEANRVFHEAAHGLAVCLAGMDEPGAACDVLRTMLSLDLHDRLKVRGLLGLLSGEPETFSLPSTLAAPPTPRRDEIPSGASLPPTELRTDADGNVIPPEGALGPGDYLDDGDPLEDADEV